VTDERGRQDGQDDATTQVVPVGNSAAQVVPGSDTTTQVVPVVANEETGSVAGDQRAPGTSLFSRQPDDRVGQQEEGSVRITASPGDEQVEEPTRVISTAQLPQAGPARAVPVRPSAPLRAPARTDQRGAARTPARRRARLALKRIDPGSVFVLSFLVSLFLAVMLLVAVFALYALLDSLGVLSAVDEFARDLEIVEPEQSLLGLGRVLVVAGSIALIDVVLLTVLATLAAFLYNLCAALTGGVEVVLAERE